MPTVLQEDDGMDTEGEGEEYTEGEGEIEEPELSTPEERERFYQELVKAREVERKKAIAEGKMDDPLVPKRLDEAITMVGTCMDMCPRFERYRRERENNLFEWEVIPGTRRVDHNRAVKMYERAAGDKTLPSDLRPPPVLKRTLNYLFHNLMPREGFSPTFNFIRDRSRSVRNDFTMQHETGAVAMECHERCARFHILALHIERSRSGFSIALEEQQLMNTLQSLKEFYEDQRGRHQSPNELEMRIYHRLIHIRDQRERHDDIPQSILSHPVFLLTTKFRKHIQAKSEPITKTSALVVDEEGMAIFAELAGVLQQQGSQVMVYLVACILERLFGTDTIDDIESIRAGLDLPQVIDGEMSSTDKVNHQLNPPRARSPVKPSATEWLTDNFGPKPASSIFRQTSSDPASAFSSIPTSTSAPAAAPVYTTEAPAPAATAFSNLKTTPNVFGGATFTTGTSAFGSSKPSNLSPFAGLGDTNNSAYGTNSSASASPFGGSTVPATSAFGGASAAFPSSTSAPSVLAPSFGQTAFGSTSAFAGIASSSKASPFGDASVSTQSHVAPSSISSSVSQPSFGVSGFGQTTAFNSKPAPLPASSSTSSGFFSTPPTSAFTPSSVSVPTPLEKEPAPAFGSTSLNPTAPVFLPGKRESLVATSPPIPITAALTPTPPSVASHHSRPSLPPINTSPSSSFSPTPQPQSQSKSVPEANKSLATPPVGQSNILERKQTLFEWPNTTTNNSVNGSESISRMPTLVVPLTPSGRSPPTQPPPLKMNPISLPGTPTTTSFQSSAKPMKSLFGYPSLQSMSSVSSEDILSPLQLSAQSSFTGLKRPSTVESPTPAGSSAVSNHSSLAPTPTPTPTPARVPVPSFITTSQSSTSTPAPLATSSPTLAPTLSKVNGKGKGRAIDSAILEGKAVDFLRRSLVVKSSFQQWRHDTTERLKWVDAVRRSDAYSERVHRQSLSNGKSPSKKRRESNGIVVEAPTAKRVRKRMSSKYVPPRTDDQLAQRLKEVLRLSQQNHDQHERRWAVGTFLELIRQHIHNVAKSYPFDWSVWLSTNSDNDGTAIWVERKFNVPESGRWATERIFSIPLKPGDESAESPGLIVFECSPLEGIEDEIERKYRILDDCSRLREVVEALPEDRHFVPSILFINWGEGEQASVSHDILAMVEDFVVKGDLNSHCTFSLTSTTIDLDTRLLESLRPMPLDVSGRLIEILSWNGLLKLVISPWREFAEDWVTRCAADNEVDWHLYSQVLRTLIELMNILSRHVISRFDNVESYTDPLPLLGNDTIQDSQAMYEVAFAWLDQPDFPVNSFIDHIYELALRRTESVVQPDKSTNYPIPKREIQAIREDTEKSILKSGDKLRRTFAFFVRRKRRAPDDEADILSSSTSSKKARTLSSEPTIVDDALFTSHTNGSRMSNGSMHPPPPSPTASATTSMTTDTDGSLPRVTTAMLRALTKSVFNNRGEARS
ncbi:hypothetical protein HETIRDRAFT_460814 [Heterobasidion irregulare TC 32-1]|uniref:SAC3/GANP/THP3 conserved domain-containing protein n=1 Tax=Heterobasidion irregulare (strain TC 32-1) TaxID=747525 RepID=W4JTW8_HETIT|nr:uncharacterized protein HETIRDRAFT_460814 [Heterobasidion irregulare TC 32-1]ETW76545.1 hypothetical protein HETIRDRAFT_460814 [Heterobasidion irregulare TC 32-1]